MAIDTTLQAVIPGYITYEQYLEDTSADPFTEWVDGKVIPLGMVSEEHDNISMFVAKMLQLWVEEHQAGVVHTDPFNMKTGPNLPGRAPDVMFIAEANRVRLRRTHLFGPCDLAVEIVSPEYRRVDTVEKYREYEAGGIPEYWILDYEIRLARFLSLNTNGVYEEIPLETDISGRKILRSRILPGLWLDVEWLWQQRRPTGIELLRAWNLL